LNDYNICQQQSYGGQPCQEALQNWVKDHLKDAFTAGKLVRKHMNHWAAIPFFTQAFDSNAGDCKDSDVKAALLSAFDLPANRYQEVVASAQKIGLGACFDSVIEDLAKASTDGYTFKNTCKALVEKNALTGLKKK